MDEESVCRVLDFFERLAKEQRPERKPVDG